MPLILPEGEFHAYLFDCDGTVADSMPLHLRAWNQALFPFGCYFPEDLFYAWAGIPIKKTVEMLNERFQLAMPIEDVANAREEAYWKLLPEINPKAEVVTHVLGNSGSLPMAIVSGSPRKSVLKTLDTLDLTKYFQALICAEDYSQGKPHPDCFLIAAKTLGVEPGGCLVFEDAELGIRAASAAGMASVKV